MREKHLLELYKVHVIIADQIIERRGQTNKFYISILTALLGVLSLVVSNGVNIDIILLGISFLGLCLCIIWWINIKSYRQLSSGKFQALHELEKMLPYSFYTREWVFLGEGKNKKKYFQLSQVEQLTPVLISIPYILLFIYSLADLIFF